MKDIHIHGYFPTEDGIKEYPWSPVSASDVVKWREKAEKYDIMVEEHYDLSRRVFLLEERCARKLEVIKNKLIELKKDWRGDRIEAIVLNPLLEVLEGSAFTTNSEEEG